MIDRRAFLKTMGGLSASALVSPAELAAAPPSPAPSAAKKPNFVVVMADDQCYRTINALNNREVRTPTFDRLMARGTTFTHCFHQGSFTGAVCVASRAMLHTGRYVWQCGGETCGQYPLLGQTLQMAGYDTYGVGKWHNKDESALRSFAVGKSIGPGFFASTPVDGLAYNRPRPGDSWTPWDPQYRGQWLPRELWDIEHPTAGNLSQDNANHQRAGARYEVQKHSCELYADSAIELLQKAAHSGNPFLLYVAWNAPHDPRQAPKEYVDMYPPDKIELPPSYLPQHPFDQGDLHGRDEKLAPFPRTPEAIRVHRSEYYALITYMDHHLGRILDALDKSGKADNTYVIVTGDHGLACGEHGLMGKGNLYDCSVRMPFLMSGPGIASGRQIDAMMYQHSLFPTVCDLAGIQAPATVQFPSLMPLLKPGQGKLYDSVYGCFLRFQRMVRTDRHKLIVYPGINRKQLFDLQEDPWELHDLSADSAHSKLMAGLFEELKKWQDRVGDKVALDSQSFGISGAPPA